MSCTWALFKTKNKEASETIARKEKPTNSSTLFTWPLGPLNSGTRRSQAPIVRCALADGFCLVRTFWFCTKRNSFSSSSSWKWKHQVSVFLSCLHLVWELHICNPLVLDSPRFHTNVTYCNYCMNPLLPHRSTPWFDDTFLAARVHFFNCQTLVGTVLGIARWYPLNDLKFWCQQYFELRQFFWGLECCILRYLKICPMSTLPRETPACHSLPLLQSSLRRSAVECPNLYLVAV